MRLNITSLKIISKKMIKAAKKAFQKATKDNIEPIAGEVEIFYG